MKWCKYLLVAMLLMPAVSMAQDYKVAVVDIQTAIASSNQYKQWKQQLDKRYSKERERLKTLADEGNTLKEKAKKEGDFMSEDQRKALVVDIQKKFQAFQQLKAGLSQEMKAQEQQFLQQLQPKVQEIIKGIVEKDKIDLIFNRRAMVFTSSKLDLTGQVIEELNK